MRDLSLSETLISKAAMYKIMSQAVQPIDHYHSNNSRFSYNGFIDTINEKDQKLTLWGVGAHQQNGIIENKRKFWLQVQ